MQPSEPNKTVKKVLGSVFDTSTFVSQTDIESWRCFVHIWCNALGKNKV